MDKQLEQLCRSDLTNATTISFFEMRAGMLIEMGVGLPKDINHLRKQTVLRNIQKLEVEINSASHPDYRALRQKELGDIKREYAYLFR